MYDHADSSSDRPAPTPPGTPNNEQNAQPKPAMPVAKVQAAGKPTTSRRRKAVHKEGPDPRHQRAPDKTLRKRAEAAMARLEDLQATVAEWRHEFARLIDAPAPTAPAMSGSDVTRILAQAGDTVASGVISLGELARRDAHHQEKRLAASLSAEIATLPLETRRKLQAELDQGTPLTVALTRALQ